MGLEQVKQEILVHAEQEAKKILTAAKEQAKKEFEAAHQTIDAFETAVQDSLQKELETLEKRYAASMQLAAKKIFLQKRRALLDAVFQRAAEALVALPFAEKKKLYTTLFLEAKKQFTPGTIFCARQDMVLVKTIFPSVQERMILGGIIAANKDGTLLLDYSFDSVLSTLQEKKLHEVARLLFGGK